ncbi:Secreted subtilisin-like serine protease sub4 [Orbilia ellipsospora]|uniref:Secreted subtilisin-like serine protease sub4 n=1 Tax=Orbilia ellipsospora TaxID=2528407 RepID=A0AAV9WZ73_9PEZI
MSRSPIVGTWGIPNAVWCLIKDTLRTNENAISILNEAFSQSPLSDWVVPPKKLSIVEVKSSDLGTWAYWMAVNLPPKLSSVTRLEQEVLKFFQEKKEKPVDYPFEVCEFLIIPSPNDEDIEQSYDERLQSAGSSRRYQTSEPFIIQDQRSDVSRQPRTPEFKDDSTPPAVRKRSAYAQTGGRHKKLKPTEPEGEVEVTRNAWDGLPVLSVPRDEMQLTQNERIKYSYYHYTKPGEGVVVYVFDTGCQVKHPDLVNVKFQDWIQGGPFPGEEGTDTHLGGAHGTTIVDKVAGKDGGIAQEAEIVVVSHVDGYQDANDLTLLDSLLKMYDHIRSRNANRPCVVQLAIIFTRDEEELVRTDSVGVFARATTEAFGDALKELLKLENVILVASAGNLDPDQPIQHYPAVLGADKTIKNIVVVGAATEDNRNLYQYDDSFENFVWAPGQSVVTIYAPITGQPELMGYQSDSGTSIASAAVSGILSVFLSRDTNPVLKNRMEDAVSTLKRFAFERINDGVPVIHNGILSYQWPLSDRPRRSFRINSLKGG